MALTIPLICSHDEEVLDKNADFKGVDIEVKIQQLDPFSQKEFQRYIFSFYENFTPWL